MTLDGQVAIVTGGGQGIGRGIASSLGGGLRPPSDTSPQESVAPAKPALEAEHHAVGGQATPVLPGRVHRVEVA